MRAQYVRTRAHSTCDYVQSLPVDPFLIRMGKYCGERARWRLKEYVRDNPVWLCTAHKKEVERFADYNK